MGETELEIPGFAPVPLACPGTRRTGTKTYLAQTLHVCHICLHWGGLRGQCRHIWHTWSVWVVHLSIPPCTFPAGEKNQIHPKKEIHTHARARAHFGFRATPNTPSQVLKLVSQSQPLPKGSHAKKELGSNQIQPELFQSPLPWGSVRL